MEGVRQLATASACSLTLAVMQGRGQKSAKSTSAHNCRSTSRESSCAGTTTSSRASRTAVVSRSRLRRLLDRKSTRLNSSHSQISYAVFCLKEKKNRLQQPQTVLRRTEILRDCVLRSPDTAADREHPDERGAAVLGVHLCATLNRGGAGAEH